MVHTKADKSSHFQQYIQKLLLYQCIQSCHLIWFIEIFELEQYLQKQYCVQVNTKVNNCNSAFESFQLQYSIQKLSIALKHANNVNCINKLKSYRLQHFLQNLLQDIGKISFAIVHNMIHATVSIYHYAFRGYQFQQFNRLVVNCYR